MKNNFEYQDMVYNDMKVKLLIPPDEIVYLANKKIYTPSEYRPPKKGDLIWNIQCSKDNEDGNNILLFAPCDDIEPKWIYKPKEETCS